MGDSKAPLRDRKPKPKIGRPRIANAKRDDSTAGRKARRDAARKRLKALPNATPVPPDHPRQVMPNGGTLLRGGLPGNKGGYIQSARRAIRKKLLKALLTGGGVEFIANGISGKRRKGGEVVDANDDTFQHDCVKTALKYGLGEISQHALVNENDEVLETGVVELPMLDAPPTPPPVVADAVAGPSLTQQQRTKALDAAAALIEAAR